MAKSSQSINWRQYSLIQHSSILVYYWYLFYSSFKKKWVNEDSRMKSPLQVTQPVRGKVGSTVRSSNSKKASLSYLTMRILALPTPSHSPKPRGRALNSFGDLGPPSHLHLLSSSSCHAARLHHHLQKVRTHSWWLPQAPFTFLGDGSDCPLCNPVPLPQFPEPISTPSSTSFSSLTLQVTLFYFLPWNSLSHTLFSKKSIV